MSVYVSFSCRLFLLSLYMWYCSKVFMSRPFISWCRTLSLFSIVPYVWLVSRMCCAYLEVVLLVRMACICSLYRVLKFLPVWPMYFDWHVLHFISYTPLRLYLSGCGSLPIIITQQDASHPLKELFQVFHCPSRQMPDWYLKLGQGSFLPRPPPPV
jgi:hypothetical protein